MTVNETEDKTLNTEIETEIEEEAQPVLDDAQIRAAALAYAKFLKDNDLVPGEMPGQKSDESKDDTPDDAEAPEEADAVKEAAEESSEEAPAEETPAQDAAGGEEPAAEERQSRRSRIKIKRGTKPERLPISRRYAGEKKPRKGRRKSSCRADRPLWPR